MCRPSTAIERLVEGAPVEDVEDALDQRLSSRAGPCDLLGLA
jgi:hypothetical protein